MNAPHDDSSRDHLRYEVTQLEQLRQQIYADMDTLRVQEQNLRAYEARLRGTRPPMSAHGAPAANQQELDTEKEKLLRMRALLEAERRALVDERLALREERTALTQKAEDLKQREAWLAVREREQQAKTFAPPAELAAKKATPSQNPFSLRLGLNEVPFAEYFRSQRRSA